MNEKFKVTFFRTYVTTIYVNATDETEAILYAHPELDEQELEQMNVEVEEIQVSRVDDVERNEEGDAFVVGCAKCGEDVYEVDDAGRCADCAH
jgi:hypothetical protein